MGTSKAYDSPRWPGVNDKVGSAAADGPLTSGKTTRALSAFSAAYKKYINTTSGGSVSNAPTRSSPGERTQGRRGGGGGATARARAATTGARLGGFLADVSSSGLNQSLERLGLSDFEGMPLEEVLDAVLDRLCEDGGLLDDSALTEAMARTLDEFGERAETVEEFDELLSSREVGIESYLQIYFSHVLAVNFEQKEGAFVRGKISQKQCDGFFKQARELIRALVVDELAQERDLASIDWRSAEAISIADSINQEVLDILIADD